MSRKSDLLDHCRRVRRHLEGVWPTWHQEQGRDSPTPPSLGTCQTSSLFLCRTLQTRGRRAQVAFGNDPNALVGYRFNEAWTGHAWVRFDHFILDVTADQFGRAPVEVLNYPNARYREGGKDTATLSAQGQRHERVECALKTWKVIPAVSPTLQ